MEFTLHYRRYNDWRCWKQSFVLIIYYMKDGDLNWYLISSVSWLENLPKWKWKNSITIWHKCLPMAATIKLKSVWSSWLYLSAVKLKVRLHKKNMTESSHQYNHDHDIPQDVVWHNEKTFSETLKLIEPNLYNYHRIIKELW